jgi:hypothetical protein
MCVSYNAYGQVLHRYLQTDVAFAKDLNPTASHELTALDSIHCGWQLFQEWVWACSPHMNGVFRDF